MSKFGRCGKRLAAVAIVSSISGPVLAGDVYKCDFPQKPDNLGYLSPTVVFDRAEGSDSVSLMDAVIQQEVGEPLKVKVVEENDKKLSMAWEVKIVSDENTSMRIAYRLSVQKDDLEATLSARPLAYSNKFWARGTCSVAQM